MTAPTIARPAPAEFDRTGCSCAWDDMNAFIFRRYCMAAQDYHAAATHLVEMGLAVRTVMNRTEGYAVTAVGGAKFGPCPRCGEPVLYRDGPDIWRTEYEPYDRVTIGGLAEAHEHIVSRVVAGELP